MLVDHNAHVEREIATTAKGKISPQVSETVKKVGCNSSQSEEGIQIHSKVDICNF